VLQHAPGPEHEDAAVCRDGARGFTGVSRRIAALEILEVLVVAGNEDERRPRVERRCRWRRSRERRKAELFRVVLRVPARRPVERR
jgi:hypothetical protein